MLLSRSFRRKLLATALAAFGFFLLYNATVVDLRSVAIKTASMAKAVAPMAGSRLEIIATAYCKGETTSAGVSPQAGIAAADPELLPEGSVVRVTECVAGRSQSPGWNSRSRSGAASRRVGCPGHRWRRRAVSWNLHGHGHRPQGAWPAA